MRQATKTQSTPSRSLLPHERKGESEGEESAQAWLVSLTTTGVKRELRKTRGFRKKRREKGEERGSETSGTGENGEKCILSKCVRTPPRGARKKGKEGRKEKQSEKDSPGGVYTCAGKEDKGVKRILLKHSRKKTGRVPQKSVDMGETGGKKRGGRKQSLLHCHVIMGGGCHSRQSQSAGADVAKRSAWAEVRAMADAWGGGDERDASRLGRQDTSNSTREGGIG